jgi:hypothetical protein
MSKILTRVALVGALLAISAQPALAVEPETQAQLDAIKAAIPKFAVPMREVGDRFQNTYFAAQGGNWALAAYMVKYMNGAMNPAALTKPKEYKMWKDFYDNDYTGVSKAIQAKDWKAFDAAYTKAVATCNECHESMDYGFIKVVKQQAPSDIGINYSVKSEPGAVPK